MRHPAAELLPTIRRYGNLSQQVDRKNAVQRRAAIIELDGGNSSNHVEIGGPRFHHSTNADSSLGRLGFSQSNCHLRAGQSRDASKYVVHL